MSKLKSKYPCSTFLKVTEAFRVLIKQCGRSFEIRNVSDLEAIPNNKLNKSFMVEITNISGVRQNQCDQEVDVDVRLTCCYCDPKDERNAMDVAISDGEGIIAAIAGPGVRTELDCITNITFDSLQTRVFDELNDNVICLELVFTAKLYLDLSIAV